MSAPQTSETQWKYPGEAIGNRLSRWSGRELTEGRQGGLKMVGAYTPANLHHVKEMVGVVEFASDVAHHFNNILAIVSGYGGLLKVKMSKDDPSLTYVEKMLASSQKAQDVIRSLFVFSGNERIILREMDLNKVIKRATRFLESGESGPEKKVEMRLELHEGELIVMADVVRMEEVLANLIGNARDAMPSGGIVTLRTEPMTLGHAGSGGSRFASITVTDTGSGMDKETRERMFDPFFTTKGPGRNIGLGLSKVYGIVKAHSGEMTVESAPGEGTSVRIRVPLVRSEARLMDPIPLPDSIVAGRLHLCSSYIGETICE